MAARRPQNEHGSSIWLGVLFALPLVALLLAACSAEQPPLEDAPSAPRIALDQSSQPAECNGLPDSVVDLSWMRELGQTPSAEPQRVGQPWAEHGVVSNEELAKQLALPILRSQFGEMTRTPLQARLERGVWFVEGAPLPPDSVGGNLYIQICQSNGRVLNIYGTQ